MLFANALSQLHWKQMYAMNTCEQQFEYFNFTMSTLIEEHFSPKVVKSHTKDKPWITVSFKELIRKKTNRPEIIQYGINKTSGWIGHIYIYVKTR